jgi:hypothetical protein
MDITKKNWKDCTIHRRIQKTEFPFPLSDGQNNTYTKRKNFR